MKKTIQIFLFVVAIFVFSSCATLFSRPYYVMTVTSDLPNSEVVINNENRYGLPTKVVVTRSRENLSFTVLQNDSIVNDTILRPRLSNTFWWGNLYPMPPFGHLIDLTSENRFFYGSYVFIDSLGNVQSFRRTPFERRNFREHEKGSFSLLIALPHVNFFHVNPKIEVPRSLAGFHGLGLGIEYFYQNDKSFQLRGDGIMTFPFPFPVSYHLEFASWEVASALNVSLTDNFHIGRWQLGYGLNFARNRWVSHGYFDVPDGEIRWEESENWEWIPGKFNANNILGLALSTHYRLGNRFHLGLIYRPSFIELSNFRPMYEHTISIDLLWKIHL